MCAHLFSIVVLYIMHRVEYVFTHREFKVLARQFPSSSATNILGGAITKEKEKEKKKIAAAAVEFVFFLFGRSSVVVVVPPSEQNSI